MPVREATEGDLHEIAALIRELAAYEHLTHEVVFDIDELAVHLFGDDVAAHVLIAETDDGTIAGFALWFPTFSTFLGRRGIWLEDLFVRPAFRGGGHGAALLHTLRAMTTGRVEWAVLDWNDTAIDFYTRIGATAVPGWTRFRWLSR